MFVPRGGIGLTFVSTTQNRQDRRAFLKAGMVWGGLLAGAGLSVCSGSSNSKVVLSKGKGLHSPSGSFDSQKLCELLDISILTLADADNPSEAWRQFVKPGQVVGLKVNCLAGRGMSTSTKLVEVLAERLVEAGIRKQNIVIWDRMNRDLERGGFQLSEAGSHVRCFGNDSSGFEDSLMTYGEVGSLVSRTLTRVCDVVINLPILKDHGITGMTGALKNMFGAIHNPNKYHLNVGDPYIPDVWMLDPIRTKVRLNICEAFTVQYHGGPSFMPGWTWGFNGLLVSRDPVALDRVGWQLIEQKRKEEGMQSLEAEGRRPSYIETAADGSHSIGTCSPDRIELVELDA